MITYEDQMHPRFDDNHKELDESEHKVMPVGESLKMVRERIEPYWREQIIPKLMTQGPNQAALVVAHEHVLRGMVQCLTGIDNEQILSLRIPNAKPFVFEFDKDFNPTKDYYVDDELVSIVNSDKTDEK